MNISCILTLTYIFYFQNFTFTWKSKNKFIQDNKACFISFSYSSNGWVYTELEPEPHVFFRLWRQPKMAASAPQDCLIVVLRRVLRLDVLCGVLRGDLHGVSSDVTFEVTSGLTSGVISGISSRRNILRCLLPLKKVTRCKSKKV